MSRSNTDVIDIAVLYALYRLPMLVLGGVVTKDNTTGRKILKHVDSKITKLIDKIAELLYRSQDGAVYNRSVRESINAAIGLEISRGSSIEPSAQYTRGVRKAYTYTDVESRFKQHVQQVFSSHPGEVQISDDEIERFLTDFLQVVESVIKQYAAAAEESFDAPLDAIAFGDLRKLRFREADNELERYLASELSKHLMQNTAMDKKAVDLIKQLLHNSQYKSVFRKPTTDWVYRGMHVETKWLAKTILGVDELDVDKSGEIALKSTYVPRGGQSSSWTVSKETATNFSVADTYVTHDDVKAVSIVLHARTSDNEDSFIDCNNGLYTIRAFDNFAEEQEVIGLGNIIVEKISWRWPGKEALEPIRTTKNYVATMKRLRSELFEQDSSTKAWANSLMNTAMFINKSKLAWASWYDALGEVSKSSSRVKQEAIIAVLQVLLDHVRYYIKAYDVEDLAYDHANDFVTIGTLISKLDEFAHNEDIEAAKKVLVEAIMLLPKLETETGESMMRQAIRAYSESGETSVKHGVMLRSIVQQLGKRSIRDALGLPDDTADLDVDEILDILRL